MRTSAASAALITAVGFSTLAAAPPSAAPLPFPNCDAAAAGGVCNIPAGTPGYGTHSDNDSDGVGCESDIYGYDAAVVERIVAESQALEQLPPNTGIVGGPPQVEQMPVGGADAGVAVETTDNHSATAAAAGGLALATVAGAVFLARRRTRNPPPGCRRGGRQGTRLSSSWLPSPRKTRVRGPPAGRAQG